MRHRIGNIGSFTGLGNPDHPLLRNEGDIQDNVKDMLKEAVSLFPLMNQHGGCDYNIKEDSITFGIEPAYMYEHLEIIGICNEKEYSYIKRGVAWGIYGSQVCQIIKYYHEYIRKGKFVRFIDKWHGIIFNNEY